MKAILYTFRLRFSAYGPLNASLLKPATARPQKYGDFFLTLSAWFDKVFTLLLE